mgnify:CR=1 FL=1
MKQMKSEPGGFSQGAVISGDIAADIAALTSNDLVLARLEVEKIAIMKRD